MSEEYSAKIVRWKDVRIGDVILAGKDMRPVTRISAAISPGKGWRYIAVSVDEDPDHYREYLRFDDDLATVVLSPVVAKPLPCPFPP